ncbi:hypothetical protein BOX15_Mlig017017g8, partial [Macrostomum lignano]
TLSVPYKTMGKGRCCKDDEAEYNKVRDHDKDFKGPIENRSCTDIVCCLLFVACVILLLLIATVAFIRGDYRRVIYPTDSNGQICGRDVQNRTRLVFFDLTVCARMGLAAVQLGCPTPQVCVASCPTRMWAWLPAHLAETGGDLNGPVKTTIAAEREKMVCLGGRNAMEPEYQSLSIRDLVQNHLCAPYTLPSVSMLGRCLPKLLKGVGGRVVSSMTTLPNNVTSANNRSIGADTVRRGTNTMARFIKVYSYLQALFEDVVQSWQWIVGGCLLAVAVSLLWVLLLRYLAKPIVILSIVLFVLLFAAATAFTVYKYIILRGQSDSLEKNTKLTFDFGYYLHLSRTWLFLAIVSGSLFIIVLFLLIWLRRRICIAIALISHTSHCLGHMMSCLVFPLLPFVLQFGVLVFFIITAIHISSLGDPVMRQIDNETFLADLNFTSLSTEEAKQKINDLLTHLIPCNPNSTNVAGSMCRFLKYGDDAFGPYMQLFNIFMFFWLFNFVDALCEMTLAGAFASYYFAFKKPDDIPATPLLSSFWRCIRYHMGSIAFGSLIISIVQLIRVMLEYLDHKLKDTQNPVGQFFLKCLKCCFWCLEKCLKFLNRNAYILIAIYGRNFCSAARDSFFLILRNIVRVAVVDKVADFVLFISKLVIVCTIVAIFNLFMHPHDEPMTKSGAAHSYSVPILIMVFTYFCACLFLSVYNMGVDTMFLCFLEDLERNDGSAEKPYFMPESLMDILGKKNDPLLVKRDEKDVAEAAV